MPIQGGGKRKKKERSTRDRGFNALSRASQVHSSVNSRDIVPIRPTTNQVLCPQNIGNKIAFCSVQK
jgi:hypothetical protein